MAFQRSPACGWAATTRLRSCLSYATGSMIVSMVPGSTPFIERPNSARDLSEASPSSVVSDLVAELAIL